MAEAAVAAAAEAAAAEAAADVAAAVQRSRRRRPEAVRTLAVLRTCESHRQSHGGAAAPPKAWAAGLLHGLKRR